MKFLLVGVVAVSAVFLTAGGVMTYFGIIDINNYALISGSLGSIASIIGLFSFFSPKFTSKDILSVEAELVQRLADATASVKKYEERISENKEELQTLEQSKLEIEMLVRQASIKVFLEQKIKRVSEEIEERIKADKMLSDWIREYQFALNQVEEIDVEICRSHQADLVSEIIENIERMNKEVSVKIGNVDITPFLRIADEVARRFIGKM